MSWILDSTPRAKKEAKKIKTKHSNLAPKFREVLDSIKEDPYSLSYKGEALKKHGHHPERELRSKRLNKKNRIVYEVIKEENLVMVISCWGHY